MRPDFLIIGAPRSGTDFIMYTLEQHPDICLSSKRETHFFDRNYKNGMQWYEQFFAHCKSSIIGEKTANYLVRSEVPKRIYGSFPEMKFIVSLRNPIYRSYSHYTNQQVKLKKKNIKNFSDFIMNYPEITDMGYYSKHIKNYFRFFPRENFHILFFEDLKNNPQKSFEQILMFLDIPKPFAFTFEKRNESPKVLKGSKKAPFNSVIPYKYCKKILPERMLKLIFEKTEKIKSEDYSGLKNYFREKNQELYTLLNIKPRWDE